MASGADREMTPWEKHRHILEMIERVLRFVGHIQRDPRPEYHWDDVTLDMIDDLLTQAGEELQALLDWRSDKMTDTIQGHHDN